MMTTQITAQEAAANVSKGKAPMPVPGVLTLAPYKQGKISIDGVVDAIKLSSNESMAGPSPLALEAYIRAGKEGLHLYPDGSQRALRAAIGETFSLDPAQIVCGNGSDELIQLLIRAYVAPDDEVIISQYSFAMAVVHATAVGAVVVTAPEPELKPDADAILERVTPKTRMVVLASPNNPVGQYIGRDELQRLRAGLPDDVILLIDSAYADYVTEPDYEADLLEAVWACRASDRLDVCAARDHRCGSANPDAVQCQRACSGGGRSCRSGR
jgi:histidinol-phosphate aminotransferase